jgi:hypothetical protein
MSGARARRFRGVRRADSVGLFTMLLGRFGALGGVDLDLSEREEPAGAAYFSE